jgi:hypothetical protein
MNVKGVTFGPQNLWLSYLGLDFCVIYRVSYAIKALEISYTKLLNATVGKAILEY